MYAGFWQQHRIKCISLLQFVMLSVLPNVWVFQGASTNLNISIYPKSKRSKICDEGNDMFFLLLFLVDLFMREKQTAVRERDEMETTFVFKVTAHSRFHSQKLKQ